jgi:hypothetical protein
MDQWDEPPQEPEEDEDWGLADWLILPFALLWMYRWRIFGGFIVIGVALAALGVFDKTPVAEPRSCPGYGLVRNLKAKGQIDTFVAVKPEEGWECEYSLDNEDALVRFKRTSGKVSSEVESHARGGSAYPAASREMRAEGYAVR